MKSSKKGAEMSLNVVIIAAVALIVLVVLVMIFTGRMNIFGTGIQKSTEVKCRDNTARPGAQIRDATDGCNPETEKQVYGAFTDFTTGNQICCVPIVS